MEKELASIMIKHNARLACARSTTNTKPMSSTVEYKWHRGGKPRHVGTNARRLRKSKRVGCPFWVFVEYTSKSDKVSISMHGTHEGHAPGSRADLYHLPVHPNVIACYMEDLFNIGTNCHVARMSLSKEKSNQQRASPLDRVIYRFFMIPREVQMVKIRPFFSCYIHSSKYEGS